MFLFSGYEVVSFVASLLSSSVAVAKAMGVEQFGIKDLSYAWAFFPLLTWVFIAYVRRWIAYNELYDEYDHCLFLEQISFGSSTDNTSYEIIFELKNTANKPLKYEMVELVMNDRIPNIYDNKSGVIGPQSSGYIL
ncbi:MAG: hypothetical protein ACI9UO_002613 [Nitrospinales bacterium]|jgi:hypothetical protein